MLLKKNVIILHPSDKSACAFYRCNAMALLLNSSRGGDIEVIVSRAEITDEYVLKYTAAVVFFRVINESQETMLQHYKRKRNKLGFKIFVDYDDLVFDINGKNSITEYNDYPIDTIEAGKVMERALKDVDGVTVTTEWLKQCMFHRFGWTNVKVLSNSVPRYCFGQKPREEIGRGLEKPVVLYAGSTSHFSEGNPGDFAGPWVPWLRDALETDRIELHLFRMPYFLADFADKVTLHSQTSCVEFPSVVASIKPDFYLAPLADNNFNRAKSNLKLLEAAAVGAVLVGSSFMWSPYEEAFPGAKVVKGDTPEALATMFGKLCHAPMYNVALRWQRAVMNKFHYWMDSHEYMEKWLRAYLGDALCVNK